MTSVVLGGGCFWCLDAVFAGLRGVERVESAYAGGDDPRPRYDTVASGKTNHAEVVRVYFDEKVIPNDIILNIFFLIHDPTTLNRQGSDIGTQYRSIMLYNSNEQKREFEKAIERAQKIWNDPIVTELSPLKAFYVAEPEHQDYFAKNPETGYCQIVVASKVSKARAHYNKWFA